MLRKKYFHLLFFLIVFTGCIIGRPLNAGISGDTLIVAGRPVPPLPDTLMFCGEPVLTSDRDVRERLNDIFFQVLSREDRITLVLRRTGAYFPFFEKVLRETGLPDDLKYLSVAESSLKLDAYSHADAGGLWQFIPSTAKIWGLTVNAMVDERFHVDKSTRASLAMLKSLRDEFGSWALAAAAYNAGPGNIRKAIAQQADSNYYGLFLNRETRHYLFHIVIIKEIIERPERYGFHVPASSVYLPYDQDCKTVTLRGPVKELGKWIQNYGMNYKQLKSLNFWIMKDQLPEGDWTLLVPDTVRIPDSSRAAVKPNNAKNDSLVYAVPYDVADSSLHYIFYTVREGDHMTKIAGQFRVSVKDIIRWNNLQSDVAMLNAKLKIYYPQAQAVTHTVQGGENLYRIAEKYRLSIDQIKTWNRLDDDQILSGMNLILYLPEK